MEKNKENLLTQSQFTFLIVGYLLGPGFIQLPAFIVKASKQDAWISVAIALVYPLYIIIISLYIIKKYPGDNIFSISKKCYGKIFGTILNIVFLMQFPMIQVTMTSDVARISITYIIAFLTPIKVSLITLGLAYYGASKGLKVLGKTNEYISYMAFSVYALFDGELLNIMPIFGSGIKKILDGAIVTSYYYLGYESILLLHTFVDDYKKIKRASFTAIGITSVIWIWSVFICIYNLGIDIIDKAGWPFMFVFESIHIPVITNFLYVFMIAWSLVAIKSMANFYFATAYMLNDITKISIKKIMPALYPIFLYLGVILLNGAIKKSILGILSPAYVLFNTFFYALTAVMVGIKNKRTSIPVPNKQEG